MPKLISIDRLKIYNYYWVLIGLSFELKIFYLDFYFWFWKLWHFLL